MITCCEIVAEQCSPLAPLLLCNTCANTALGAQPHPLCDAAPARRADAPSDGSPADGLAVEGGASLLDPGAAVSDQGPQPIPASSVRGVAAQYAGLITKRRLTSRRTARRSRRAPSGEGSSRSRRSRTRASARSPSTRPTRRRSSPAPSTRSAARGSTSPTTATTSGSASTTTPSCRRRVARVVSEEPAARGPRSLSPSRI